MRPMTMTITTYHDAPRRGFLATFGTPFRAVGEALLWMIEAGPTIRTLERLSETSEADFRARGTTRDAEVRRIMGLPPLAA